MSAEEATLSITREEDIVEEGKLLLQLFIIILRFICV